jgi:predicted RNA binding protein YcfA (HicA-like mRNA interferase family)
VRLPRDISGEDLARLLKRYGYQTTRQTGSHMRLTSTHRGDEHHITIPRHKSLRVGTLIPIAKPKLTKKKQQLMTPSWRFPLRRRGNRACALARFPSR